MPSAINTMEATKKLAEKFYSLEEFKALVVGNPDASLDVYPSKQEEGKTKSPFWFACGSIRGSVDKKMDPMTAPIVRIAQFADTDDQGHPTKSYCLVAGLAPVISF